MSRCHVKSIKLTVAVCTAGFNVHTFCFQPTQTVFVCFVWISEQTAIISLYSINWLVCITETECVYCAVRTGYAVNLIFKRLKHHPYFVVTAHSAKWCHQVWCRRCDMAQCNADCLRRDIWGSHSGVLKGSSLVGCVSSFRRFECIMFFRKVANHSTTSYTHTRRLKSSIFVLFARPVPD